MSVEKGAGELLIVVFLAASFMAALSLGLLSSTYENALGSINFQGDTDFLNNFVATNVKAGCKSNSQIVSYPKGTNYTHQLSSVKNISVDDTNKLSNLGADVRVLKARMGDGEVKQIPLDHDGWIFDNYQCDQGIKINTTWASDGVYDRWVDTPADKVQHFRIIEDGAPDEDEEGLMIQVMQTDG